MTVEARELYSSSMGPIVSGSRTPFRANAHRARVERSLWRRIGEDQSGGNGTILQPVTRCAFSPMSELGSMLLKKDFEGSFLATLIQDQGQTRNLDSKIYLRDSIVSNSNSTASLRRLFQQHRSQPVKLRASRRFALRPRKLTSAC